MEKFSRRPELSFSYHLPMLKHGVNITSHFSVRMGCARMSKVWFTCPILPPMLKHGVNITSHFSVRMGCARMSKVWFTCPIPPPMLKHGVNITSHFSVRMEKYPRRPELSFSYHLPPC